MKVCAIKYPRSITIFSICAILLIYELFSINITTANDWGLEEQPSESDKCDSVILNYDGKRWDHICRVSNIWLNAIYGFDSNDIFAVGEYGVILHYDGKSWTNQESHVTHRLNRIWGSSHNNIYVSGDYGTVLHYNGTEWEKCGVDANGWLSGIWGFNEKYLFIVSNVVFTCGSFCPGYF